MVASRSAHKPVSKRARFEVLRRDGNRCRYCGATADDSPLTDNLVAACKECNAGKTSTQPDGPLVAEVADDAIRWARAMQVAADERQATREQQHEAGALLLGSADRDEPASDGPYGPDMKSKYPVVFDGYPGCPPLPFAITDQRS